MTVTQVGCMPYTTSHPRREVRGYPQEREEHTSRSKKLSTNKNSQPVQTPVRGGHSHLNLAKRKTSNDTIETSGLSPLAQILVTQLSTAIYAVDLINLGSNLNGTCQDLQASANLTSGTSIGVNLTQAADFICAAYAANVTYIDPTVVQVFAAALYAVELAGNFTGTTNTTALCASIDLDILTLPAFGVDGTAIQSYVCNATPMGTTLTTTTITATVPPVGNTTSLPPVNMTISGIGPGIETGTGTGTDTGVNPGAGPPEVSPSAVSPTAPPVTGPNGIAPNGTVPNGTAPLVTGPGVTGYGGGVSGYPYGGNLTAALTGSGSGYAYPTSTASNGDSLSINFSPYYDPSSLRLPPSPGTGQYYPAVSRTTSAPVFYGYEYGFIG